MDCINNAVIRELLCYLPSPNRTLDSRPVAKSPLYRSKTARAAFALNAPQFGWYYVRFWLDADLNMPSIVNQESLVSLNNRLRYGQEVDEVLQALELLEPDNAFERTALEAYALCRDLDIPQISDRVNMSAEAITIFYDLCFNVRNRTDEPLYLAKIVYPERKLADLRDDGFDPGNIRQNLFRLAHECGSKALEYELGTRIRTFSPTLIAKLASGVEARIMSNARTVARLGGLNSKKPSAGLLAAFGLLQTARQSGQRADSMGDNVAGLGAIGAARSTLDSILRIQRPDLQKRYALQRGTQEDPKPSEGGEEQGQQGQS
jgi:hypothetical protein